MATPWEAAVWEQNFPSSEDDPWVSTKQPRASPVSRLGGDEGVGCGDSGRRAHTNLSSGFALTQHAPAAQGPGQHLRPSDWLGHCTDATDPLTLPEQWA